MLLSREAALLNQVEASPKGQGAQFILQKKQGETWLHFVLLIFCEKCRSYSKRRFLRLRVFSFGFSSWDPYEGIQGILSWGQLIKLQNQILPSSRAEFHKTHSTDIRLARRQNPTLNWIQIQSSRCTNHKRHQKNTARKANNFAESRQCTYKQTTTTKHRNKTTQKTTPKRNQRKQLQKYDKQRQNIRLFWGWGALRESGDLLAQPREPSSGPRLRQGMTWRLLGSKAAKKR